MVRSDTYRDVRAHLDGMSDAELEAYFWELSHRCVEPLIELARTHTSPSIERSVLMRMGLDSLACGSIVNECEKRGLLGHGAGHIVWHCAQQWECDVREAGRRLADDDGWDTVEAKWGARP